MTSSSNLPRKTSLWSRLLAWAKRYGASEIVGTLGAYVGYFTVLGMTQNPVASAYGGSIGESVGFFGVMLIRDIVADRARAQRRLESYGAKGMSTTIRGLFLEFGPAELLDTALVGPLAMGIASYYLGPWLGILVGKLASDAAFYGYAIFASEMCEKRARAHVKNRLSTRFGKEDTEELKDVIDTLARSEAFGSVSPEDLEFLATLFERRDFADAEVICHRGDEAKEFYVINDGHVEIKMDSEGPTLATLGRSAVIGEYGIFTGSKRTATIIAKGAVKLLALDYERFKRFMLAFPEGTIALFKATVLRQLETQQTTQSRS
jgi:Cyclic nucleotide-binding domain